MNAFSNMLESVLKWLVIVANAVMLLLVFAQVITRYVFGYTPDFGEELARYLFVWLVFLSMPLVAKHGGHMCIETITNMLQGKARKNLNIVADLVCAIFLAIMVWQGILIVDRMSFQTSPAMEIPMSYVYVVIPFGCAVMLLYVLMNLVETIKKPASAFTKDQDKESQA